MFCFWDKCIWIVCIALSLLLREYLSLAVNVLRKGLKNFHESKSDFYNSITVTMITQDYKGAHIKIESVFRTVYLSRRPLKREFFDIYLSTSFVVRNFGKT